MPDSVIEVKGLVVFEEALTAGGVMHVFVENVSRADAVAQVAARLDMPLPAVGHGQSVPFRVFVGGVDERSHYAVRVHVDCSGNGLIKAGDHLSTQSYPVLTQGAPDSVRVLVIPIDKA